MSDDHRNRISSSSSPSGCLCNLKRFPQYVSEILLPWGWNAMRSPNLKATPPQRNNNTAQIRFSLLTYWSKTCEGPDKPNWHQLQASAVFLPKTPQRPQPTTTSSWPGCERRKEDKGREKQDDAWKLQWQAQWAFLFYPTLMHWFA